MRRNKEQRAAKELDWQKENDMPGATCEGRFYIWNGGGIEPCACKDTCEKHGNYLKAIQDKTLYEIPQVQFYYVENFRKCKFKNKENE